jgi:hypothetical protein
LQASREPAVRALEDDHRVRVHRRPVVVDPEERDRSEDPGDEEQPDGAFRIPHAPPSLPHAVEGAL